ncbi:unnamed protein product [Lepidochelys olivacea]
MIQAAEEICPEKVDLFKTISLLVNTVACRIEDIASNIIFQLNEKAKKFEWFSLALDESTDVSDTLQLLFIRGVGNNFEVTEEVASMHSMHGTTTGEEIFKEVEKSLSQYNLQWKQLKCITTDRGRNMCSSKKGLVGQIYKACERVGCPKPMILHCILHQQALYGKYLDLSCVMEPVVSTVNFIRSHGLNHHQFQAFLVEIESEYHDLPYHISVRWLSRGNVFLQFFELRTEIEMFLNKKKITSTFTHKQ